MEQSEIEATRAASAEVSREFKTLINADDVDNLKQLQHLILGRLQDSNAVLSHFNEYSEHCFAEVSNDFSRNVRLLRSMKLDLDYIFQKLRSMKAKISATYPDACPDGLTKEVPDQRPDLEMPRQARCEAGMVRGPYLFGLKWPKMLVLSFVKGTNKLAFEGYNDPLASYN